MSNFILTPRVSEKALAGAETGTYVFEVPTSATKVEIAKLIAKTYKVEVTNVNTLVLKGKTKRYKRVEGRQKDVKKAVVTLKKGQSIKIFEESK